ncbi:MAG: 3-hydroxyacyl-ACP dehydratase [Bacteroidia bacterium]|nr:3-hydroxyacyl-ACP dehydratase [Bacteroidia bacterium]
MANPGENILSYIPQRAPFVMVDEIIYSGETITRSKFHIKPDNIFIKNGFLKEPGLIENIAQTAAAREGLISQKENKLVRLGYIGAIKNMVITGFPQINDEIITEIKIENQVFKVILITGKIVYNEIIIARCEMKIFIL